tara:strand:- start:271 stop:474 length:204 start_codon:yes stop_codon:yes gene_type:complete
MNHTKQEALNISFRDEEKFLKDWIRQTAKTNNQKISSLVKRMFLKEYWRVEKSKGELKYPIFTSIGN